MKIELLCTVTACVAFAIGFVLFKIFIPILRKVKLGQKILEIGPAWHKSKEGTPNLGGLFFITACAAALATALIIRNDGISNNIIAVMGLGVVSGLIGFVDDYVKLFKKRNKGLSAIQKLILQFVSVAAYLFFAVKLCGVDTVISFPWGAEVDFGIFYYVIMLIAIAYIINCANLTDGIDGLAGSIALVICTMFLLLGINSENPDFYIPSSALIGALLAFLVFNFHPAKIFMGDTGSLFLGGYIVGLTMLTGSEFILIPIAGIWIIEGLSVVLQVLSFKLTGKRIFKMSPIHHHFEKCSWSEVKIVLVFSLTTVLLCGLSYYLILISGR